MTMVEIKNDTLRQQTLEAAKRHKASWIELGQFLYTVHKDKHFKTWGYLTFEAYCKKELAIKETTAAKLLKSYFFLEKEEPRLVQPKFAEEEAPKKLPDYESVNLLRLAKENGKITTEDYADLRDAVINEAKEPKEVRAQVKEIILAQQEARDPNLVRKERRNTAIKRLVTFLTATKKQLESEGLIPGYLAKQITELAVKLEDQIEE